MLLVGCFHLFTNKSEPRAWQVTLWRYLESLVIMTWSMCPQSAAPPQPQNVKWLQKVALYQNILHFTSDFILLLLKLYNLSHMSIILEILNYRQFSKILQRFMEVKIVAEVCNCNLQQKVAPPLIRTKRKIFTNRGATCNFVRILQKQQKLKL